MGAQEGTFVDEIIRQKIADEPFQPPNGQKHLICTKTPSSTAERVHKLMVMSVWLTGEGRSRRKHQRREMRLQFLDIKAVSYEYD